MNFSSTYATYPCGGFYLSATNISLGTGLNGELHCVWLVEYPSGDDINKVKHSPTLPAASGYLKYSLLGIPLASLVTPLILTLPSASDHVKSSLVRLEGSVPVF